MWDIDHGAVPSPLSALFTHRDAIHGRNTRQATSGLLEINPTNSVIHGTKSLRTLGDKTLNMLKTNDKFRNSSTKKSFLSKFKASLLERY